MSKHTPGPWIADAWVGTDPYDDPDGPFVMIGDVHWSPNKVDVPAAIEQTANARLIAAAPDLLEAIEAAIASGMVPGESITSGPGTKTQQGKAAAMLRSAIAKAKGDE